MSSLNFLYKLVSIESLNTPCFRFFDSRLGGWNLSNWHFFVSFMNSETFEVESILDSKQQGKKTYYLVHWKGYSHKEDTWEPEENLINCKKILDKFKKNKLESKKELESSSEIDTVRIFNVIVKNKEIEYYAMKNDVAFMITKNNISQYTKDVIQFWEEEWKKQCE